MIGRLRAIARRILGVSNAAPGTEVTERDVSEIKALVARVLIDRLRDRAGDVPFPEIEFQVYSQFGDDGIIQHLVHQTKIEVQEQSFIEFGVQNYKESNTRFLLTNDNWRGMVLDCSAQYIEQVKSQDIYWRHDLTAIEAFVDRNNVNDLFQDAGFSGDIGLLSIDIDGNDYWVWESVEIVRPVIVVVEYNSLYGGSAPVTIPYEPSFDRTQAHYSYLYWGTSLKALEVLAKRKGYALVGSNSAGNNAFFVREDRLNDLPAKSAEQAYVSARFREARDKAGQLSFLPRDQGLALIADLPLVDVEKDQQVKVGSLIPGRG